MTDPTLSLVVVTWNSADVVGDLLDALVDHPPTVSFEVLVIDNGSEDDTLDLVSRHPLGTAPVANGRNRGLAAANNQGLAAARGEYVVICNPDIVPAVGALDALVACAGRHSRAAFVVARLRHPDGALQTGVGDLPTFREAYLGRGAARRRQAEQGFWWDGWSHNEERQVGHGQEACYLVRRSALADVGVQDESYRLDWEGVDWSARVARAGWEIWFCPAADVVHVGGTSMRKARVRWIVWSHRGMLRYFAADAGLARRLALLVVIGLRMGIKLAASSARRDLYARALRAGDV